MARKVNRPAEEKSLDEIYNSVEIRVRIHIQKKLHRKAMHVDADLFNRMFGLAYREGRYKFLEKVNEERTETEKTNYAFTIVKNDFFHYLNGHDFRSRYPYEFDEQRILIEERNEEIVAMSKELKDFVAQVQNIGIDDLATDLSRTVRFSEQIKPLVRRKYWVGLGKVSSPAAPAGYDMDVKVEALRPFLQDTTEIWKIKIWVRSQPSV